MIICVDIVKVAPVCTLFTYAVPTFYYTVPNLLGTLQMPNVVCLQEDITTERCKIAIKRHIKTFKVDLVLNDGAPNVGQNWSKDAFNQSELTLEALKLATQATSPFYLLLVQKYLLY